MRGADARPGKLFSYVDMEDRIPSSHPLRSIRRLTDDALKALSGDFDELYSRAGRCQYRSNTPQKRRLKIPRFALPPPPPGAVAAARKSVLDASWIAGEHSHDQTAGDRHDP